MLRISLSLLFCAIACSLTAQNITVGIKGAFNNTWIFNQHISDAPAGSQDYFPTFGGAYGLSGAIFFKKIGIELNALYATHSQKYNGDGTNKIAGEYESSVTFNKIDFPLLFKVRSKDGAFFEIGPQFSAITSSTYELDRVGDPPLALKLNNSDSLIFSSSAIDIVFGIGVDIDLFMNFAFTTALRFDMGLTDLKGVNALGEDLVKKDPYRRTWSASAGLFAGITWRLGKKD